MFDVIKEKLGELFGGATEQLGVNPEEITSQVGDAVSGQVEEVTGQVEDVTAQAQEAKDTILPGGENK